MHQKDKTFEFLVGFFLPEHSHHVEENFDFLNITIFSVWGPYKSLQWMQ